MRTFAKFINEKGEKTASLFLAIFAVASLVIMVLLVAVGVLRMGLSIPHFLSDPASVRETADVGSPGSDEGGHVAAFGESAVGNALEGLECIFLAPLAFLLVRGIWDFVDAVVRARLQEGTLSSASPAFLIRVKALILGLMIAVVATDLLKRAISQRGLSYEPAVAGCLFIAVLAAYSFVMERSSERQHREATEQSPKAGSLSE
jgi:hypothetical protein